MATTVVSVVIFLLGVMVGRGVPVQRQASDALADPTVVAAAGPAPISAPQSTPPPAAADAGPAAAEPPPPAPEADELSYKKRLEGEASTARLVEAARRRAPPAPAPKPSPRTPEPTATAGTAAGRHPATRHLGRAGACAPGSHRRQRHRAAAHRQELSRVSRCLRPADRDLQGARRPLQGSRAGAARRRTPEEGRTVQLLDYAVAILSGALLALSFPKFGHPAFAWIALTPLVVAIVRRRHGGGAAPQRAACVLARARDRRRLLRRHAATGSSKR